MIFYIYSLIYSLLLVCTISLPGLVTKNYTQLFPLFLNFSIVFFRIINNLFVRAKWFIFVIPFLLLIYISSINGFSLKYFTLYYFFMISVPIYYIFLREIKDSSQKINIFLKNLILNGLILIPIVILISQVIDFTGIDNGLIGELRMRHSFNEIGINIPSNSRRGLFGIIPESAYVGIYGSFALLSYFSLKRFFNNNALISKQIEKLSLFCLFLSTFISFSFTSYVTIIFLYLLISIEKINDFIKILAKYKLKKNNLILLITIFFLILLMIIINKKLNFRIIYLTNLFFRLGLDYFFLDHSSTIRAFSFFSVFESLTRHPFGGGFDFTPDLFLEVCNSNNYFLNCDAFIDRNHNAISSLIVDSGILFLIPCFSILRYLIKNKIKFFRGFVFLLFISSIVPFPMAAPLLSIVISSTLLDPEIYNSDNFSYIL